MMGTAGEENSRLVHLFMNCVPSLMKSLGTSRTSWKTSAIVAGLFLDLVAQKTCRHEAYATWDGVSSFWNWVRWVERRERERDSEIEREGERE